MIPDWRPTAFLRYEGCVESSTGAARIVTDAGKAYLKAMGNAEGPHALACEWVGTKLAGWFGLRTFDCAIMQVLTDDEISLGRGKKAQPGPAFVSRSVQGHPWGGSQRELRQVLNPQDFGNLVVFDTWIRNRDRHAPGHMRREPRHDNVFLASENAPPKRVWLLAIDHTHCFMEGGSLTEHIRDISEWRDESVYGLFPKFKEFIARDQILAALGRARQLEKREASGMIESLPGEWEVPRAVRVAWVDFLIQRAAYLADTLLDRIGAECWPGRLF